MSLLRLLTAGKSLVGLQDYRSRYVTRAGALPKFGSKKNPFRATTRPESGAAAEPSCPLPEGVQQELAAEGDTSAQQDAPNAPRNTNGVAEADAVPHSDPPLLSVSETPQFPRSGSGAGVGSRSDRSFDWSRVVFWKRDKPVRQALPKFGKPMVQGELSLEGVRVVRNDLSDSDLEIVSAKPLAPPSKAEPVTSNTANDIENETAWARVTGRIFGPGKL